MSSTLPNLIPSGGQHIQRLGRCRLLVRRPSPTSRHGTPPPQQQQQQPVMQPPLWTKRLLSSSTPLNAKRVKPDVERLRRQPAKTILDYLTPMPSHLLTTLLSDLLPYGGGGADDTSQGAVATDPALFRGPSSSPPPPPPPPPAPGGESSSPTVQSPPRPLPQGHHLVYFPIQAAPSQLAPDGADMDHSPGAHYSRRLWAGGEVTFRNDTDEETSRPGHRGLLVLNSQPWTCTETIGDVRVKDPGHASSTRGGEKVFVDVWRRYALGHPTNQETSLPWSIEERRTLVFMNPGDDVEAQASSTTPKTVKYPHEAAHGVRILPSPRHLFHFSALTFNAHAIHLDPEYARSVDGHRAPLVHGPLTLALMLRVLTGFSGQLVSRFIYRNYAPLYVNEPLTVKVRPVLSRTDPSDGQVKWDAWVEGPDGGLAVKGTATMAT
ncbi:mitochondrial 3-hydroxyacyl-thioester dehydratase [Beauveria brongniartii RCEF 3172]|uniref:Mitochondrial 3-hydroxyacyl-thioester dehydratase n=1 Tax=Beauveria brongniartii RCEF 3172 TaxID=1081107 RepID=A0A167H3J5_9HYPO|nr:mitochondrial 3-hydroxyacyl-thioester dehydratase [Beauveria brongniartii RCEF 3172]